MTERPLQPQVFRLLARLVEEASGLHYESKDASIAWSKMVVRAGEVGFDSLLDYYYALRYDDPSGTELRALVDALVVHETYLFREWDQLKLVVDDILAPAVRRGARPRLWSAACSTGEEPFSVAMLLQDRGILDAVDLVASDISGRALSRARSGALGPRALRAIPAEMQVARWLEGRGADSVVAAPIRSAVDFRLVNLQSASEVSALGAFDVILCRNVLIYFADAIVTRVVDQIAASLRPGGSLFVGISESLMRFGLDLACEERGGVFLYRRP